MIRFFSIVRSVFFLSPSSRRTYTFSLLTFSCFSKKTTITFLFCHGLYSMNIFSLGSFSKLVSPKRNFANQFHTVRFDIIFLPYTSHIFLAVLMILFCYLYSHSVTRTIFTFNFPISLLQDNPLYTILSFQLLTKKRRTLFT